MSTLVRPPEAGGRASGGTPPGQPSRAPSAGGVPVLRALDVPEGWLAVLGYAAASQAVAGSIASAHWQPGLTGLPLLVGLAVLLGYLTTRGRLVNWLLWAFGLALGLVVSVRLPAAGFLSRRLEWQDQVAEIGARLVHWISGAVGGRITQEDVLIALAVASFAYVWVYVWYLVTVRLHQGWLGCAMLGAPLFANVLLKPAAGGGWLVLWAAGSLSVLLSLSLYRRRHSYVRLSFAGWRLGNAVALVGGLLIASVAVLVFASAPPVKLNQTLNDLYQRLNGPIGQARRAYDQLGVPREFDAGQIRTDSFQAKLRFLGPFRPGSDLVMKIRSDRARYQQGEVFDHYDHDGWTNTRFNQFQSSGNDYATLTGVQQTSRDRDRQQIAEEVTAVRPAGALLFAPPLPLGASVRLKGDGLGDLRATQVVQPNQTYTSASLESVATAEALAAAAGPLPPEIARDYLQLPPDLPARVRQLAQQQTAGKTSAFDKAQALETFLRSLPYDPETPPPPAGRDGVDWFLFDLRRGYSDYSASAMAVMLRALGIPSRPVAGYAPGVLNPEDGLYHVTQKEAHTWTQAYFTGYGWIDFEPSPHNPAFPRVHDPRAQPSSGSQPSPAPTPRLNATPTPGPGPGLAASASAGGGSGGGSSPFPWWLILLLAAVAGCGLYLYSRLRGAPGARLAYTRLTLTGSLLGLRRRPWQTPREYGHLLQTRRRFHRGATDTITSLYTADCYGPRRLDERANRRAWTAWQYLKGRLLWPWRRPPAGE